MKITPRKVFNVLGSLLQSLILFIFLRGFVLNGMTTYALREYDWAVARYFLFFGPKVFDFVFWAIALLITYKFHREPRIVPFKVELPEDYKRHHNLQD